MKTRNTMISMALVSRWPKRRIPRSNSVSGGAASGGARWRRTGSARRWRRSGSGRCRCATLVPRKTQFNRSRKPAVAATGPGRFSTGKLSPVRTASLTKKSAASRITPSAGTRLPAASSTTSPGTTSSDRHVDRAARREGRGLGCAHAPAAPPRPSRPGTRGA